jgi:hypothetical protein
VVGAPESKRSKLDRKNAARAVRRGKRAIGSGLLGGLVGYMVGFYVSPLAGVIVGLIVLAIVWGASARRR